MSEKVPAPDAGRRERAADGFIASYVRELMAEDATPALPSEPVAVDQDAPASGALEDDAALA
jgi:hypothetical protein